jgi:hypothetical protein
MTTLKEIWAACPTRDRLAALVCLLLAASVLCVLCVGGLLAAAAEASDEAYAYYDVECSYNECIRFNPQNGESWILACPGVTRSCEWDTIEVREP